MTDEKFYRGCKECEHSDKDGNITDYCLHNCNKLARQYERQAAREHWLYLLAISTISMIILFILTALGFVVAMSLIECGIIAN